MSSAVFYRDLHATYQSVVSAEGMYLRTDGGQRILDAVGGAGTVVLGHGVRAITDAIARHGSRSAFVTARRSPTRGRNSWPRRWWR